jgi:hypothetical protein
VETGPWVTRWFRTVLRALGFGICWRYLDYTLLLLHRKTESLPYLLSPSAPGVSAGQSATGVGARRCPRHLLERVRGRQWQRDGDRVWPGCPPRVKLGVVGDAHEVVVPRGLEVQAPEPNFESGEEGV